MQSKRQISQAVGLGLIGMPCCHSSRGKAVSHAGRQLVDPIATGRIPYRIDSVRIDIFQHDQAFDEICKQRIDVLLMPHIPGVPRGAGREIDPFLGMVQAFLVFPLLIVDFRCNVPAAMQRNIQAALAICGLAVYCVPELHGHTVHSNLPLFYLRTALLRDLSFPLFPDRFRKSLGFLRS